MADTTLTNGNFWSTVFTTPITAINDTDSVLVKDASGNPLQISAAGQTPTIALKTIGGIKAIYVTYKGASAADTDWTLLVTASDLMFTFDDLTDAQKQSFTQYFTDAITNCNNATSALKNMTSTYSKGELTITINY